MVDIDASTPAYSAAANDPWVSASFTPPNDSLLVVMVTGDGFTAVPTHTPTSTGLTFSSVIKAGGANQAVMEIFRAFVGSNGGSARTVSVSTNASSDVGGVKVFVIPAGDFDPFEPFNDTGSGVGSTANEITPVVTQTTRPDTRTFGCAGSWIGGSLELTSTDTYEEYNDADISYIVAYKAADTASPGDVTLNFNQEAAGAGLWTWVAVAVQPPQPVQVVSQGAAVEGTTSITTAAYGTGWAEGDMIIYTVASNHATEEVEEPTVAGFTKIGTFNGGGGTQGAGTGNRRLTFFAKEALAGDDTTPSIALASGNVMIAASTVLRHAAGLSWDTLDSAFGAETTAGTGWTQATGSVTVDAADVLLLACAVRDTSSSSAEGITATSSTFGTVTERTDLSSETGNDIALHVSTVQVATGPSTAAPTRTATHSTSETGVVGVLRVRAISGTTAVGKDLSLLWDTRAPVGDSVQAVWDVRAIIGDEVSLLWDVRTIIGDAVQALWDIRQAVGDEVSLLWDVDGPVAKELSLRWDVRAPLGDELQLVWTVLSEVGDSLALAWDTRAAVGDALQVVWDVRAALGDTLALLWDVREVFGESISLAWDVRSVIGDTVALIWDVRSIFGEDLALVWDVRSPAGDSVDLRWDVRSIIGDSVSLVWDVRAAFGEELVLLWDVESEAILVSKDLSLLWAIDGPVGKEISLRWDVRSALGEALELVWDTRVIVSDPLDLLWDIRATLPADDLELLWDVRSVVGDPLPLVWDVRTIVGDDLLVLWAIDGPVGKELVLLWDVESDAPLALYVLNGQVLERWRTGVSNRSNGVIQRRHTEVLERWRTVVKDENA